MASARFQGRVVGRKRRPAHARAQPRQATRKWRRKGLKGLIPDSEMAPERAEVSRGSRLHPLAVGLRRLDGRLDKLKALDPIVDGREMRGLERLFSHPGGFDGKGNLRIDVG